MVRTITKVGDTQALIFDAALLELTGLKLGDQVNVTVHERGVIVIMPLDPMVDAEEARKRAELLIKDHSELFRRLA